GNALVESSAAKIFFTGSVDVGRGVGTACAERLKGCVLELGGKDPQLVLADANLANAISGCLWGGFANAGQACSGIERVYVVREEIFGPVVPIVTVDSEEEAVALANDSEFGLGASIWSLDRDRASRIGRRLETGMVWLNDHMYSHGACQCAWGGAKHSGLGRAHSKFGFYECVNVKLVVWEPGRLRDFWWHPYDETLGRATKTAARLLYGREADRGKVWRE